MKFREILLKLEIIDNATRKLSEIQKLAAKASKVVKGAVKLSVDTTWLDNASASAKSLDNALGKVKSPRALSSVKSTTNKLASEMGRARAGLSRAGSRISSMGSGVSDKLGVLDAKLSSLSGGLAKVAAVSGGIVYFSTAKAADYEELLGSIENRAASPEDAEALQTWVKEGQGVSYSSGFQRARAAAQMTTGTYGGLVGAADQIEFLAELERTLAVQGAAADSNIRTLGDASSLLNSFLTGSVDTLNDLIPGFQMSNERIAELRDEYRTTRPELAAFTDEEIDLLIGMQEATRIMQEANQGKAAVVSATVEMKMAFEKLSLELGGNLVPGAEFAADALNYLARLAEEHPEGAKIAAYALGAALVTSAAAVGLAQIVGAAIALRTAAAVVSSLGLGVRAYTAVQWALNVIMTANPLGLAVVGLAALVLAIAYFAKKTELIEKIGEKARGFFNVGDMGDLSDPFAQKTELIEKIGEKARGFFNVGDMGDLSDSLSIEVIERATDSDPFAVLRKIAGHVLDTWESIRAGLSRSVRLDIPDKLGKICVSLAGIHGAVRGWRDEITGGFARLDELKEGVVSVVSDAVSSAFSLGGGSSPSPSPAVGAGAGVPEEGEPVTVTHWKAAEGYAPMVRDLYGKTTFSAVEYAAMPAEDQELLIPASVKLAVPSSLPSPEGGEAEEGGGEEEKPGLLERAASFVSRIDVPFLEEGGQVLGEGLAVVHEGEEVAPSSVVGDGESLIDRLSSSVISSASPRRPTPCPALAPPLPPMVGAGAEEPLILRGPLVRMDEIRDQMDVADLCARVRDKLLELGA